MLASDACLDLIKRFEGFRDKPYQDVAGYWTIGYGHRCAGPHIGICTEDEAELFLRRDLTGVEEAVSRLVKVPVSQPQFDALCCFAYNVGTGNFSQSTLLRRLNDGDMSAAAAEFLRWDVAGGQHLVGLHRRRQAESELFQAA